MSTVEVGIRLTANGSILIGQTKLGREVLERLAHVGREVGREFDRRPSPGCLASVIGS